MFFFFSKELGLSAPSFIRQEDLLTWRKLIPRVSGHKTSASRRSCMREYLNLVVRLQNSADIDAELQQQIATENKNLNKYSRNCIIFGTRKSGKIFYHNA